MPLSSFKNPNGIDKEWAAEGEVSEGDPQMAAFPNEVWDSVDFVMLAVAWLYNEYRDIYQGQILYAE